VRCRALRRPGVADTEERTRRAHRFWLGIHPWPGIALAVIFALPAGDASATPEDAARAAAVWLELHQNADGSWGDAPEVRPLLTSESVLALRAHGRWSAAYFRGITWLENRAMTSVDSKARRVVALAAHGDDVTRDSGALQASFSERSFLSAGGSLGSGWGLAGSYGASALDTGLVLLAFGALGVPSAFIDDVIDGAEFLLITQGEGSDMGWQETIGSGDLG